MPPQGNLSDLSLQLVPASMQLVNQPRDLAVFWSNIPILLLVILVNVRAAVVIRRKENNGLHNIIVWDCAANVLFMSYTAFYTHAPWFALKSAAPCYILTFVSMFLAFWNRLVPVGIVIFRYLMVCHAVFCFNHGAEKGIWRRVKTVMLVLSIANPLLVVWEGTRSYTFMRCLGREEGFR